MYCNFIYGYNKKFPEGSRMKMGCVFSETQGEHRVRLSGIRATIAIAHIGKFYGTNCIKISLGFDRFFVT